MKCKGCKYFRQYTECTGICHNEYIFDTEGDNHGSGEFGVGIRMELRLEVGNEFGCVHFEKEKEEKEG